jgi:large subunit ribosomal protein L17
MGLGAKGRKLGRDTGERTALFRQLVSALILHERITTTEAKAKETKKIADGLIELAVRSQQDGAARVHAHRQVSRILTDIAARKRLFAEIAPRYSAGRGGYTRVIKTRARRGDNALLALVELVPR